MRRRAGALMNRPGVLAQPVAPAPTTPGGLTPLLWMRPDRITGLALNDLVHVAPDLAAGGHDFVNAGATAPKFHPAAINGKAVLEFDGSRYLQNEDGVVLPLTDFSLFMVLRYDNGGRAIGLEDAGGGAHGLALYDAGQQVSQFWVIRNNGAAYDMSWASPLLVAGTPYLYELVISSVNGARAYINGKLVKDGGAHAWSASQFGWTLGASGSLNNFFIGAFGDVLVIAQPLADWTPYDVGQPNPDAVGPRIAVEDDLMNFYGIARMT